MFKPALNIEAGSWLVQASIQQNGGTWLAGATVSGGATEIGDAANFSSRAK
jgi:hypothetical protein